MIPATISKAQNRHRRNKDSTFKIIRDACRSHFWGSPSMANPAYAGAGDMTDRSNQSVADGVKKHGLDIRTIEQETGGHKKQRNSGDIPQRRHLPDAIRQGTAKTQQRQNNQQDKNAGTGIVDTQRQQIKSGDGYPPKRNGRLQGRAFKIMFHTSFFSRNGPTGLSAAP